MFCVMFMFVILRSVSFDAATQDYDSMNCEIYFQLFLFSLWKKLCPAIESIGKPASKNIKKPSA
jgi:hypothetical protein